MAGRFEEVGRVAGSVSVALAGATSVWLLAQPSTPPTFSWKICDPELGPGLGIAAAAGAELIVAVAIAGAFLALSGGFLWLRPSRRRPIVAAVALGLALANVYGGHRALGGNGYRCQPSPFTDWPPHRL